MATTSRKESTPFFHAIRAVTAAAHSLRSMNTVAFEFGFGDDKADMKH